MSETMGRKVQGDTHVLDDVIRAALAGRQSRFSVGDELTSRFQVEVAPFGALADTSPASFDALLELVRQHGPVALSTVDKIEPPGDFSVIRQAALLQMIWQGKPSAAVAEHARLDVRDVPDMIALTDATQPGPFGPRTIELGNYFGVRDRSRLVAMAGERLKVDGYTEISAVCVDPSFRGRGLAASLIKRLIAAIRERDETPFLHVLTSNHGAIGIYRALGFIERREMHLTVLGDARA